MRRSELLPRIHDANACLFKVSDVARYNGQIMLQCGCGDKSIDPQLTNVSVQSTPAIRDGFRHREYVSRVKFDCSKEPFLEDAGLYWVFNSFEFYAATNFCEGHHANHQGIICLFSDPFFHAWLALLTPQFGKNVRIEQPFHHNLMSRVGQGSRAGSGKSSTRNSSDSKCSLKDLASPAFVSITSGEGGLLRSLPNSKSGAISPSSRKASINVRFFFGSASKSLGAAVCSSISGRAFPSSSFSSAAAKMRRCSSSADTPCSTARSLSCFTSDGAKLRTSNCAMPHSAITDSTRQAAGKGGN